MRTFITAIVLAGTLGHVPGKAQPVETGFLDRSIDFEGTEYLFQVYVPRDYDGSRSWPVILALHGSGERGADGLIQTEVGLGSAIRRHAARYPAIVVFPQCPGGGEVGHWQDFGARLALATLDQTLDEFNTDTSAVYLTGLSMGGNGAWYLGFHHPDRFAAMVVICGWISRRFDRYPPIAPSSEPDPFATVAERLRHVPIWIFHGDEDDVISVEESRRMASALEDAKADVRYSELAGVNHNSWDYAYAVEELPDWLFSKRR